MFSEIKTPLLPSSVASNRKREFQSYNLELASVKLRSLSILAWPGYLCLQHLPRPTLYPCHFGGVCPGNVLITCGQVQLGFQQLLDCVRIELLTSSLPLQGLPHFVLIPFTHTQ